MSKMSRFGIPNLSNETLKQLSDRYYRSRNILNSWSDYWYWKRISKMTKEEVMNTPPDDLLNKTRAKF